MNTLKTIVDTIAPEMKTLGFKRRSVSFAKSTNDIVWVLAFQKNVYSTSELLSFTVNIGIYYSAMAEAQGFAPSSHPKVSECQIETRLGELMPGSDDYWWEVATGGVIEERTNDVAAAIRKFAIPYLEQVQCVSDMLDMFLRKFSENAQAYTEIYYACQLLALTGDGETLERRLDDLRLSAKDYGDSPVEIERQVSAIVKLKAR